MKNLLHKITSAIAVGLFAFTCVGFFTQCESEVTDSTEFMLYYTDVVDIAPSMNLSIEASYIGAEPSDFEIYRITYNSETIETDAFTINSSTGTIRIYNTNDMPVGTYCISVACNAGGKRWEFPDIVTINMMSSVPEGITVEPSVVDVTLEEALNGSEMEIAQVVTDGNHVTITGYSIANVRLDGNAIANDDFFKVSSSGVISMLCGNENFEAGVYVLDLKITTEATGEDSSEGLYSDALTVNITSPPLSLSYTSSPVNVEYSYGHVSSEPTLKGSLDGINYSIKAVDPADAPVTVDATTGVITLAENTLAVDTVIKVGMTVTNTYGSADFDDVYEITIVSYIDPLTSVKYDDATTSQGTPFTNSVVSYEGDDPTYAFGTLDDILASNLSIDPRSGEVSAVKGHTIPLGEYTVNVVASNVKSEVETSFKLTVETNPYWFTYVSWGNNLGLTPVTDYASQFREKHGAVFSVSIVDSDLSETAKEDLTFEIDRTSTGPTISIGSDGTLNMNFSRSSVIQYSDVYIVTVTAGKGKPEETSVQIPIFTQQVNDDLPSLLYTPFVFQVNPKTGGTSTVPTVEGAEFDMYIIDYRRQCSYYNFKGPDSHKSGQISTTETDLFIDRVWLDYYTATNRASSVNYGANQPMSYYYNDGRYDMSVPLGYIDGGNNKVFVVNPDKFIVDDVYANGFWVGTCTYLTDGNTDYDTILNGAETRPIILWFDTDF